jgi:hypothetical protein
MRQSLIRLRHASITTFSAASLVAAPLVEIEMCPVESDIAIEIQSPSACASGVATNATPIAIATTAVFFMGFPTLLHANPLTRPEPHGGVLRRSAGPAVMYCATVHSHREQLSIDFPDRRTTRHSPTATKNNYLAEHQPGRVLPNGTQDSGEVLKVGTTQLPAKT